ncbi:hypothetical protein CCACVL1_02870 [Corchorus capsularis]|uniref:Uncharacterized protein n=1 Tax=Corchorus capsularis TaxID=210143 RepID=A0A1R3K543_COCAP|nr:hypothetical protein CCACVL1_02870 [Corchorus capsularis]
MGGGAIAPYAITYTTIFELALMHEPY